MASGDIVFKVTGTTVNADAGTVVIDSLGNHTSNLDTTLVNGTVVTPVMTGVKLDHAALELKTNLPSAPYTTSETPFDAAKTYTITITET
jgi:hypothetical protein